MRLVKGVAKMTTEILLVIPSHKRYIDVVAELSMALGRLLFDHENVCNITLAVVEAGINAIKHGNKEDIATNVEFIFHIDDDKFTAWVKDRGGGFNLDVLNPPLNPDELHLPEGRGILLMQAMMDEVEFTFEEGTCVKMVKYVNS